MRANELKMAEMNKSWEEKLAEAASRDIEEDEKKKEEEEARASGRPQLLNLNADGMLDRKIFIDLSKQTKCSVGRRNPNEDPTLVLGGIGIQQDHVCFETSGNKTVLKVLCKEAVKHTYVNGLRLKNDKPVTLKANDRVIFGVGSVFLFRNEDNAAGSEVQDTKENPVSYEFAMQEKIDNDDKADAARREEEKKKQEEETAKKMAELDAKMQAERDEQEAMRKKMQDEYDAKMAALQAEVQNKQDDE